MQSNLPNFGLADFISALFRNKKKVIFIPLMIIGLAAVVILFAPRTYRSEAKLFLQIGRESVNLDPTATTGDTISVQSNTRDHEIVTAMESIKSRGTIERVVDKLGDEVVLGKAGAGAKEPNALVKTIRNVMGQVGNVLKQIDPISDRERAIILIERNLNIEAENDSTLITAKYEAETPELAQLVTKTLIEVYKEEHRRMHRTKGSLEFFQNQRQELEVELTQTVDSLRQAKNRMGVVSIDSRRQTLESRLGNIELRLYSNLQSLAASKATVADLKKQFATTPERLVAAKTTVPNTGTDLLREQVFALQVLMLDQQTKYSEDHPSLQATREQLREAQAMLDTESIDREETTDDINPNYSTLSLSLAQEESQLAGFAAQSKELNEQRDLVAADLEKLNDNELELDKLQREASLVRTNFFRSAENLRKALDDEELDEQAITNAIEMQAATLAEKPVSPNKLLIGALAMMLSFFSVGALILVSEKLSTPIYKEEQLEESLQLPVFGTLPEQKQYVKRLA